jgi:hypothetical protein
MAARLLMVTVLVVSVSTVAQAGSQEERPATHQALVTEAVHRAKSSAGPKATLAVDETPAAQAQIFSLLRRLLPMLLNLPDATPATPPPLEPVPQPQIL